MSFQKRRFLLVGCGLMGGSLLRGFCRASLSFDTEFHVVTPRPQNMHLQSHEYNGAQIYVHKFPGDLLYQDFEAVLFAVKPQIFEEVFQSYKPMFATKFSPLFISVAAGLTTACLQGFNPKQEMPIVRVMPNLPVAVGQGVSIGFATKNVTSHQRNLMQDFFGAVGHYEWIEREDLFNVVTALSGSGPGYVFLLVEAMAQAAASLGLDVDVAQRLARHTVSGTGKYLESVPQTAHALRTDMTRIKGTTAAAIDILLNEQDNFFELFQDALAAASEKALALSIDASTSTLKKSL